MMKDITENFGMLYHPQAALIFYQSKGKSNDTYVEYFDMDSRGQLLNAHPLTVGESKLLAKTLAAKNEKNRSFLRPKGILPTNILYINPCNTGSVAWYTKARKVKLYFSERLEIPNGTAEVPAMLWYADKYKLYVFALMSNRRPKENTPLYHAPFFNVYDSGNVCMGTVDINIKNSSSVEEFTVAWEKYFFNSYFSHLNGHNPINGNCVFLWKDLINTDKPFPKEVLKMTNKTLKNLLS